MGDLFRYYVTRSEELEKAIKWHRAYFNYVIEVDEKKFYKDRYTRSLSKLDKARRRLFSLV